MNFSVYCFTMITIYTIAVLISLNTTKQGKPVLITLIIVVVHQVLCPQLENTAHPCQIKSDSGHKQPLHNFLTD